jgi:hypothetical protein
VHPQRRSTRTDQIVLHINLPCGRELRDERRQVVPLREAVANEQQIDGL